MKMLIATTNPHKVEEVQAIFAQCLKESRGGAAHPTMELLSLKDLPQPNLPEAVEDEPTFEGNAVKKAMHYAALTGLRCLADDSGLEVDALGGEPGVRSARYAGVSGPRSVVDTANNALLLQRLHHVADFERDARFVCAMAVCDPGQNKPLALVRGTVEGNIIGLHEKPRGENGFGYDPLFVIKELGKTTAELEAQEKNAISHRGRAARLIWRNLIEH